MYLLPAIDILDGKVVRLKQGDYSQVTVYSEDPVAVAADFAAQGATWIHAVDLDGAREGQPCNEDAILGILSVEGLSVEVGGGIRTYRDVAFYQHAGVRHVVLGTMLVKDAEFTASCVRVYGNDLIVAGIDSKDGVVKVEGWTEGSAIDVVELSRRLYRLGIRTVECTDISRDGMGTGIDASFYTRLALDTGMEVVASGGVANLGDLKALFDTGRVGGAIVGRAIYEGSFTVKQAVDLLRRLEAGRNSPLMN